ncbi:hypothetical protein KOXY103107_06700 [Komagataeibacter xylinus]
MGLGLQFLVGRHQAGLRFLVELRDSDITDIVIQRGLDDLQRNDGAREGDDDGLGRLFADQGQGDARIGLAAHAGHDLIERLAINVLAIDRHDEVTGLDACAGRGRVINGGDHAHMPVLALHFKAEAAK